MQLPLESALVVLCGKPGSGKTLLLQQVELSGYPCINLEKIASHRGTAFGGIGLPEQPSQKYFEDHLMHALLSHAESPYIFIEQKTSPLGKRKIPSWLQSKMSEGILVQLNVDKKTRIENICNECCRVGKDHIINSIQKIKKRLPLAVIKETEMYINEENFEILIEKTLDYFDKSLKYSADKKPAIIIPVQHTDPFYVAQQLLHSLKENGIIVS